MGTARSGDSELIRLTLIDYFTTEVLVDQLVYPAVPMSHLNSRFSGVTWKEMNEALEKGTTIHGRDNARKKLWSFVGPDTIVVGHSLNNDFRSLRWIHHKVVDTFLVEYLLHEAENPKKEDKSEKDQAAGNDEDAEEGGVALDAEQLQETTGETGPKEAEEKKKKVPKGEGKFSLKTLTRTRLGREIQNRGKEGHDSLEDALATRDLADWHVKKALGMLEPPM